LQGETLDSILESQGRMPLSRALPILIQIADALEHSHTMGIIHRDLKAPNVLLTREHGRKDVVKLLDFGIAQIMAPSFTNTRITAHGYVLGTPEYMSPEQIREEIIDGRSDLYALGILAYELLTGMPPFVYDDPMEVLQAHLKEFPVAPSENMPDQHVPKLLDGIILKCLEKVPADRYPSGNHLKVELLRVRNLMTQMISTLVIPEEPSEALADEQDVEIIDEIPLESGSIIEFRDDFHEVTKEIIFAFLTDELLDHSANVYLDRLLTLESELSGIASNISRKEQEFEKIREEFGKQEENLRYAHMDLQQEYRKFSDPAIPMTESHVQFLKDLQFQIQALDERIDQVLVQKRAAIGRLNSEIGAFHASRQEREMEISFQYLQMQDTIEVIRRHRTQDLSLRHGVLLGKYDHIREIMESVRRNVGTLAK
ncbi:serine/threonine protein kinase, partial [Myxococcota bacterium]|nr:serine/threonine protein kinase [Myxococcota bacterium]